MTSTHADLDTRETLVVSEIFGPTYQGEGPLLGRVATFIRLGGCNLSCSWCDTPYTWDGRRHDLRAELKRVEVRKLVDTAVEHGSPHVVLTGGEPLLHQHQPGWSRLLRDLRAEGITIQVETNGTVLPTALTREMVDHFNVSPKLANTGDTHDRRFRPDVLSALAGTNRAIFKFVCRSASDVAEVALLAADVGLPSSLVWIMPEGTTRDGLARNTRAVVESCLSQGFNFTPRLHVLIWEDERGR